jgi:hypothetical protein
MTGCPLDMIELHADVYHTHDFLNCANAYGYRWDHLGGPSEKGNPQHANFHVPLEELNDKVMKMVKISR